MNVTIPEARRLFAIMMGDGKPHDVLTPLRKRLLRGLHDGLDLPELGATLNLTLEQVCDELAPLIAAHLVVEKHERYLPAFLVAQADEVQQVEEHARVIGHLLADRLLGYWAALEKAYHQLALSLKNCFADLSFLLVGDRVLDIYLLDVLAQDGTLMPPAPARPSPGMPEARYYFWMIEGKPDQLGRYGQHETALPWKPWNLLTFGSYWIGDQPNRARKAFEASAQAYIMAGHFDPANVAEYLHVPTASDSDARKWHELTQPVVNDLMRIYLEDEQALRSVYHALRANAYAPHSLGEFFCWYDHLAYAFAIDALETEGVLFIPPDRFTATVWYEEP